MMFTYFTSLYGLGGGLGGIFPSSWKLGEVFKIVFMFKLTLPPKGV